MKKWHHHGFRPSFHAQELYHAVAISLLNARQKRPTNYLWRMAKRRSARVVRVERAKIVDAATLLCISFIGRNQYVKEHSYTQKKWYTAINLIYQSSFPSKLMTETMIGDGVIILIPMAIMGAIRRADVWWVCKYDSDEHTTCGRQDASFTISSIGWFQRHHILVPGYESVATTPFKSQSACFTKIQNKNNRVCFLQKPMLWGADKEEP